MKNRRPKIYKHSQREEDDLGAYEKVPMEANAQVSTNPHIARGSMVNAFRKDTPGLLFRGDGPEETLNIPEGVEQDKTKIEERENQSEKSFEDQEKPLRDKTAPDHQPDPKTGEPGRESECIEDPAQGGCSSTVRVMSQTNLCGDSAVEVPQKDAGCRKSDAVAIEKKTLQQIREILNVAGKFSSHLASKTEFSSIERLNIDGMECKAYCCDLLAEKMKSANFSDNFIYNKKIRGKSGSLIFFTEDFKCAIKVIRPKELKVSIKNMPLMAKYLDENRHSLIVRSIGLYSTPNTSFIVMENIFDASFDQIFDLKGTNVKRRPMEISTEGDWRGNKLLLKDRKTTMRVMSEDTSFLRSLNLMDYSLVIGRNKDRFRTFRAYNGMGCEIGSKIESSGGYSLGIVDVLTEYDLAKRLERIFHFLCCMDEGSAIHPKEYQDRFLDLVCSECFVDEGPTTSMENK